MRTDSLSLGIELKPDENQIRLLNPSPPSFLDMVVLRDLRPAEALRLAGEADRRSAAGHAANAGTKTSGAGG